MIIEEASQRMELAYQGYSIWKKLKEEYSIKDTDCLVLFPCDDNALNATTLKYLPEYMKTKYYDRIILFSKQNNVSSKIFETIDFSGKDMDYLVNLYKLTQFSKRIVMVSLQEPFSSSGIIGNEGIDLDDYVKNALLV